MGSSLKLMQIFLLYVGVGFQSKAGVTWQHSCWLNTVLDVKILRQFVVSSASVATVFGHTQSSLQVVSPREVAHLCVVTGWMQV